MRDIDNELMKRLREARKRSWEKFGKKITFYLPGIFTLDGNLGKYPALSITGGHCPLACDHCKGQILLSMDDVSSPDDLLKRCRELSKQNNIGVLISGGCDKEGKLPWKKFLPAIKRVKDETKLHVSVHCGFIGDDVAYGLKLAGVDQALIDIIGDSKTLKDVYHLPFDLDQIEASLNALEKVKLPFIPHIVCGLHFGELRGERNAIEMLSTYNFKLLVFVGLMGLPATPMWKISPPRAEEIADLIARARSLIPNTLISLGCARERGNELIELLAIEAGVNRLALPSEEALKYSQKLGLTVKFQNTCCSVDKVVSAKSWFMEDEV